MFSPEFSESLNKELGKYRIEIAEICNKVSPILEGKMLLTVIDSLNFMLASLISSNFKEKDKRDSFLSLQLKNIRGLVRDLEERDSENIRGE